LLTDIQKEQLKDKVYRLLGDVGMRVEHETLEAALIANGCEKSSCGRIRMPASVIDAFVAAHRKTQAQDAELENLYDKFGIIDYANFLLWTGRRNEAEAKLAKGVHTSIFDCGPTKYYDYPSRQTRPVDTNIFITAKKWAQAVPEVGYISTWYRQDVPPRTERIESLVLALKYTDKVGGIEAIYPEVLKYLQEIGEIITGRPGENAYVCGSQCISPPLIFEHRSAEEAVERLRLGIHRYHIASMISIGMNTPPMPASVIVMIAAELLGGMVAVHCLDPGADITGRILASAVDMRNAQVTSATLDTSIVNFGVKELFDAHFGGHARMDTFFTAYARRPGLQAVVECFTGAQRLAQLRKVSNIGYPGVGTLDNGGTGSLTQAVLDLEIRRSLFVPSQIPVDEEAVPFEEICDRVAREQDFFTSEHTLSHFREMWYSQIFRTDDPDAGRWAGDETAILDTCDDIWRAQLGRGGPPTNLSGDQTKALDALVVRARKELLGD
jgi:trimethylamine:corrinoid methyltransferase-like protein